MMETTYFDAAGAQSFRPELAAELGTGTRTPGWDLPTDRSLDDGRTLARGIGWFSLALGVAEVAAPRRIAGWLGMEDRAALVRAYGVREIAAGVGVLASRRPTGWLRGRLAGDALDLATLADGLRRENPRRGNVMLALGAVAGVTALDALCERQLSGSARWAGRRDGEERVR
jgi:hypothetical protein